MNTRTMGRFSLSTSAVNRRDPPLLRGRGQVLQQDRAETPALLVVLDHERDLGPIGMRRIGVVGAGTDDERRRHRDQADRAGRGRRR